MGGDDTGAESSNFCRTRTGGGRNAELPQEFDARGGLEGRTPSRPPPEWAETIPERNLPTSAGRGQEGGGMRNFHKNLMLEGGWRAGRPPDLPPNGRRRYRSGIFRLLQDADRRGGGMRNFHKNLMLEGAGGPDALQTSPRMAETIPERNLPTSAERGQEGGTECGTSTRI